MKIKWLVTNVTAIGGPVRVEIGSFWVILDNFRPVKAAIVGGESLCDVGMPSCGLKTLLMIV